MADKRLCLDEQAVAEFLRSRKAATLQELEKKFGESKKLNDLLSKQVLDGSNLFVQRFEEDLVYKLQLEKIKSVTLEPKIWIYDKCTKQKIPYLWIRMPETGWKKIIVVPISDLQWGSDECDEAQFREYVQWIKKTENVFAFINGDLLNNALASSVGGSVYFDKLKPRDQVQTIIDELRPIAHKILWAIPGNHEERTVKLAHIDPLQWVCSVLEIPYFDQPIFANILWNNYRFNFYCFHGTSGSQTMGGNLNAAARPTEWTDFTMFYVMGHVHQPMANSIIRRCVLREYDKAGKLVRLRIVDRDQYIIVCSAWLEFFGSYAHRSAYSPPPQGTISCYLLANGGYEISQ